MKKKLMMVAVLLGALSLGACVDNDESASVEAVRNAKAKQLESVAALNNAKAEAEKITAEAEAALKNAQAEYQKEMTEEAKQKFAVKLELIKANAERDIALAKKEAAEYEQQLLDVADAHVRELYASYKIALGDLTSLNSRKIGLVANIASAKEELIPFTALKQIEIDRLERLIANEEF
ncbi:putative lipoprotein, partial [Bacteroides fragilis str. 3783N2-1]